jgi:hypothetical protein
LKLHLLYKAMEYGFNEIEFVRIDKLYLKLLIPLSQIKGQDYIFLKTKCCLTFNLKLAYKMFESVNKVRPTA